MELFCYIVAGIGVFMAVREFIWVSRNAKFKAGLKRLS